MTLIELMVVIVVLGIVATMIVPTIGGSLGSMELKRATRDLGDLMDYCYHAAIDSGRVHALILDSEGRRFDIVAERLSEWAADGTFDEQDLIPAVGDPLEPAELEPIAIPGYIDRVLPVGIRVAGVWAYDEEISASDQGRVQLLFFPDATAEFAVITLVNEEGDQCKVSIDGLSGLIEVTDTIPAAAEGEAS
jgi:type II secretion system protein H